MKAPSASAMRRRITSSSLVLTSENRKRTNGIASSVLRRHRQPCVRAGKIQRTITIVERDVSLGERDVSFGERDALSGQRDVSFVERDALEPLPEGLHVELLAGSELSLVSSVLRRAGIGLRRASSRPPLAGRKLRCRTKRQPWGTNCCSPRSHLPRCATSHVPCGTIGLPQESNELGGGTSVPAAETIPL